ncbi:uncharacterized protein LOC133803960 [Humulus lupulus]|uniref:uncharacterized protein LOC133803960 n=1 Tax=Humulus lupulus TaxID=3486 RepID=UPI002B40FBD8|nr:uncharacterized protein LOC133803960 [Humulus lupulus]
MASKPLIIVKVPIGLSMFLKILIGSVKYVEPGFMIYISMEVDIMVDAYTLYISHEDIVHFGLMEEIETLQSSKIRSNIDNRAKIISGRIINTLMGQTWLMEYHFERHWMLVIIDPDNHMCYYLDLLRNSPPNDLTNLMNSVAGRTHITVRKSMKLEMNR